MGLVGRGVKVYTQILSRWYALPGLGTLTIDDPAAGGTTTQDLFDGPISTPGVATVGNFTVECQNLGNGTLYQRLANLEGQSIPVEVVMGLPDVRYISKAAEGVAIDKETGELTFTAVTGSIRNGSGLSDLVSVEDTVLVNKTVGVGVYNDVDPEVYSLYSLGGGTESAAVYPFKPDGTAALSADKNASGFIILGPQQRFSFNAPAIATTGMSITGTTTPASRSIIFTPATAPKPITVASRNVYKPS